MNRDAFYKYRKRDNKRKAVEEKVVNLVQIQRREQPRMGTRKLHFMLKEQLNSPEIKVGRDRLFDILRDNKMLVKRKKTYTKTTNSFHRFYKYKNLIKDIQITRPNQVWVADITYLRTHTGFCYLALITDLFSRRIVGYDVSNTLELAGCTRAFKRALVKAQPVASVIHHSDRGIQYCSNQYVELLVKNGFQISMTEENHCYENAVAERVNGILKDEFFLDQIFFNIQHAKQAVKNAIDIYNNKRFHLSLQMKTPNRAFFNNQN
jgi:putative transposase